MKKAYDHLKEVYREIREKTKRLEEFWGDSIDDNIVALAQASGDRMEFISTALRFLSLEIIEETAARDLLAKLEKEDKIET